MVYIKKPPRHINCEICGVEVITDRDRQKYCVDCGSALLYKRGLYANSPCWKCEFLYSCRETVWEQDDLPCFVDSPLHDYWLSIYSDIAMSGGLSADAELTMKEYIGQEMIR